MFTLQNLNQPDGMHMWSIDLSTMDIRNGPCNNDCDTAFNGSMLRGAHRLTYATPSPHSVNRGFELGQSL